MKFTPIKQTLIGFTVFLIILFLGSCSVADDTAPPSPPQPDYMSFVLTNSSGDTVTTTTELSRGNTYGLVITPTNDAPIPTADYTIIHTPADAIIIDTRLSNSVDFTVDNAATTTLTFTVTHRTNSAVSESITLNLASQATITTTFEQNIQGATVPNLILADALTREVLSPLGSIRGGAVLEKRYVTTNGGGSYNGSSWVNAWAATNLRNGINTINNATANRVYLVMVAGGTYKPDYSTTTITTTERDISFGMKNHVAIMGGFDPAGGWRRTGTTVFSGDIGTVGSTNDNSYNMFFHNGITLNNAHLYGVTITNGNANSTVSSSAQQSGGGMYNSSSSPVLTRVVFSGNIGTTGGGMYNSSSSPVLTRVVFSSNTANVQGGGMYNINSSSPVLTEVVFSGNTADSGGGGMYNSSSSPALTEVVFSGNSDGFGGGGVLNFISSPVLTRVVFSGNIATGIFGGGGMFNIDSSSPVLTEVVFSGNTATANGGGMYNNVSSPVMIGAVFINNTAANGGAMANDNGGQPGPLIVNTIFSGNTLSGAGRGTNIAMDRGGTWAGTENIRIAGSVLGIGLAQPTNGIVGYVSSGGSDAINIEYHSLANGVVNFGVDANLTVNGMSFPYPTIQAGSSAINLGLFVRRSGTTYYFSEDTSTWYTGFTSTGAGGLVTVDTPPATAEDLTATDIAGNARSGRPDAGVHEVQ